MAHLIKKIFHQLRIRDKGQNNTIRLPKKFKNKNCLISILGNNNVIEIGENFSCGKKFSLRLIGSNNRISIGKNFSCRNNFDLSFYANESKVEIADNVNAYGHLSIDSFGHKKNLTVAIGEGSGFMDTDITCFENNSSVIVGKDCMFSYNTVLYNTDGHPVFEKDGNKVLNRAKDLIIGDHVWVGHSAVILKNVQIGNGCIVGRGAIVTKSFLEENCSIAGVPAKICKHGIRWERAFPDEDPATVENRG